jgi:hypothetical protein
MCSHLKDTNSYELLVHIIFRGICCHECNFVVVDTCLEGAVEHNSLASIRRANARAVWVYSLASKTTCFQWLLLFLMVCMFFMVVILIPSYRLHERPCDTHKICATDRSALHDFGCLNISFHSRRRMIKGVGDRIPLGVV